MGINERCSLQVPGRHSSQKYRPSRRAPAPPRLEELPWEKACAGSCPWLRRPGDRHRRTFRSPRRIRTALSLIAAPTLLVYGEEDHRHVAPANKFLAEVIPNSTVVSYPRTGHMVNIEESAEFNRLLRAHIAGEPGRSPSR